jgi:Tfp pilus assembly protein PilX
MCSFETGKEPRGVALIISMLIMAVLLLAGTTFLTISSTESSIALNEQVSTQALSLAGAGLQQAMAKLNAPTTYPGYSGESNVSLGTGTFTVAVSTSASQSCGGSTAKDVVVTGSVPIFGSTASVQIKATMDKIGIPFRFGAFATVPNTIVAAPNSSIFGNDRTESELWVGASSQVDSFDSGLGVYNSTTNKAAAGRIGGNGDVTLDANVQVQGPAQAGDSIHVGSGATVSGGTTQNLGADATSPGEQFPQITPPSTATSALSLPQASCPSCLSWSITPGTYYWTSLTMANNVSLVPASNGVVTIYITGNISLGTSVTLGSSPGTNMLIIMKSNASLTSTAAADMASFSAGSNFTFYGGLYGMNANINIGQNSHVYGSVIGRTTWLQSGTQLHYDQAMMTSRVCGAAKYVVLPGTWREITQ